MSEAKTTYIFYCKARRGRYDISTSKDLQEKQTVEIDIFDNHYQTDDDEMAERIVRSRHFNLDLFLVKHRILSGVLAADIQEMDSRPTDAAAALQAQERSLNTLIDQDLVDGLHERTAQMEMTGQDEFRDGVDADILKVATSRSVRGAILDPKDVGLGPKIQKAKAKRDGAIVRPVEEAPSNDVIAASGSGIGA